MSWACIIKILEVLEQISGHKVQLKSKSHKKRTSESIMFQLPPQIVLGCSNSKWYLNLVFHPLNTSCKNQESTRHEHNVTAFYTKLYWFHHGRSLPRTFSLLTFSITEPSQLHSSSAIGFRHYAPLTLIPLGGGAFMAPPPPCHFFRCASRPIGISRSNFMTFFSQVSRIFWYIIHPGRTCRTDVRGR